MHDSRPILAFVLLAGISLFQSCNSPFQVKQDYSPRLVLYGIAFRGDSVLSIRVETNSETPSPDSTGPKEIAGLNGTLENLQTGIEEQFSTYFRSGTNLLEGVVNLSPKSTITVRAGAEGYPACTATLTILDQAIIYPAYWTTAVLRGPATDLQDPQFTIYPSALTAAIRVTLHLRYHGTSSDGKKVDGDVAVNPSYQTDTTSYFLKIGGEITAVEFPVSVYSDSFAVARGMIKTGVITAVVELTQIDAPLYNFYSVSNGFNDPFTMRTERPLYTNVRAGLGFVGSASRDSLSIRVYP